MGGLTPRPDDTDLWDLMDEFPDKVEVRDEASEDTPEELALKESVDDDFRQMDGDEVKEEVKDGATEYDEDEEVKSAALEVLVMFPETADE